MSVCGGVVHLFFCKPQRRRTVHNYGLCPREHAFVLFITVCLWGLAFSQARRVYKHINCNRIIKVRT